MCPAAWGPLLRFTFDEAAWRLDDFPTSSEAGMGSTFDRPKQRWQRSKNPYTLVQLVKQRGLENQRKFRLVAAACCRRAWPKLKAAQRRALEVIERYADGEAKYTEMRIAAQGMRIAGYRTQPLLVEAARRDAWSGLVAVIGDLLGVLWGGAPDDLEEKYGGIHGGYWEKAADWDRECAMLCHIVRDSFANVFQPVTLRASWRTSTVLELAKAAYQHRDLPAGNLEPARLAVLADALEEAGCDNGDLLAHIRGPGPHVRGCWALDLALAKE
jgi:hypothetical protein